MRLFTGWRCVSIHHTCAVERYAPKIRLAYINTGATRSRPSGARDFGRGDWICRTKDKSGSGAPAMVELGGESGIRTQVQGSTGATGFVPIPNERRDAASWEMTETVAPTRRERK
jgi:hypothetical protein